MVDLTRWPLALTGFTVSNDDDDFPPMGIGRCGGRGNVNGEGRGNNKGGDRDNDKNRGHDNHNGGGRDNANNNSISVDDNLKEGNKRYENSYRVRLCRRSKYLLVIYFIGLTYLNCISP